MKKHIALIISLCMILTLIPGAALTASAAENAKLAKPTLINYAAGSTSIRNTWKKVKGAKGYEIYRAGKQDGEFKKVKTIKSGKTVSWTNKKLKKNKNYYYKIKAYNTVRGKKTYGKFSKVQWAKPTNNPNYGYSMSKKKKKTRTVKIKITNKSRYDMVIAENGAYAKDKKTLNAMRKMTDDQLSDANALAKVGYYGATTKARTIKPGKTATISYTLNQKSKITYTSKGLIIGQFKYGKTDYSFFASVKLGSDCTKL